MGEKQDEYEQIDKVYTDEKKQLRFAAVLGLNTFLALTCFKYQVQMESEHNLFDV